MNILKAKVIAIVGGRPVKSYAILKAKGNHQQVGKESGQTNHIERYWATLRARITRYVRKSLSFSRKLRYHHLVTKLFINTFLITTENLIYLTIKFSVSPAFRIESGTTLMSRKISYLASEKVPNEIKHAFPLFSVNVQYKITPTIRAYAGWA